MLAYVFAAFGGAVACLALIYWASRRHQSHTGRTTGPNSRVPVSENVVPIVKKG